MPQKNKGKGGKRHRRGKKGGGEEVEKVKAPRKEEDGQEYAQVVKMLGDSRILARLFTSEAPEKTCIIPGKFKKRVWINKDDIILVGTRDEFSDNKCDVLYKYNPKEVRQLIKTKQIDVEIDIEENQDDNPFEFKDDDEGAYFDPGTDAKIEIDLTDL